MITAYQTDKAMAAMFCPYCGQRNRFNTLMQPPGIQAHKCKGCGATLHVKSTRKTVGPTEHKGRRL